MWSRIWRQCTLSLLLVCFIISIKDFNIHAQLIHSFVNIPTSDLYGNNNAPILKALAKVYYSQGFKAIDTNPGFAMEKLISSYKLHPTIYTYEMLRWAYSMIGQATALDDNPNYLPLTDRIRKQRAYFLQQCDFGAQEVSAGNYDRAIEYFESILLFDVDNVANGHSNNEKSAEKIVSLELFEVYFNLAVAYRQLGMAEKAVDYNIHAINLNPIHSKSILNLATIFQQNGALDKAEEWYLRGINVHRAFKQLTNTLGYAFLPDDYLKFSSNLILTYFQMQEFNKVKSSRN